MTLAEHNNSIHSREDFVAFVKALGKDLRRYCQMLWMSSGAHPVVD